MVFKILVKPTITRDDTQTSNIAPKKRDQLPKLVTYLFRLYQIIFAIDFGFFEYKSFKIKFICRSIATFQALTLCGSCIIFSPFNTSSVISNAIFTTEYVLAVCVMNFAANDTFHKFLNTLLHIDTLMNFQCFNNSAIPIFVFIMLSMAGTLFSVISLCHCLPGDCPSWHIQSLCTFPLLALDSVLIIYIYIFFSVYRRLVRLTIILKENVTNITTCHSLYKSIIDSTLKVKSSFDIVVCMLNIL